MAFMKHDVPGILFSLNWPEMAKRGSMSERAEWNVTDRTIRVAIIDADVWGRRGTGFQVFCTMIPQIMMEAFALFSKTSVSAAGWYVISI